ncbi:MAG: PAS domain-containing protein [Hyphomicrobiales bacterium]|nr:PAS domain-containing protein [Hyphomicrobiales bacterium]
MSASDAKSERASNPVDISVRAEVLDASSEACWCIEFGIPVDVTAPDSEVVRQVFENDPYWRFSNPAMARLYLLPGDENLNDRPVDEIFPRNPQNEEFVVNLIANGFEVDAAPALDTRYDGVQIDVENDVRAHIEDGRLIRMFGIVRDISKHRRREAALQTQLRNSLGVLNTVPMPVLAIDKNGDILLVNAATERQLSMRQRDLTGQSLRAVLALTYGERPARRIEDMARQALKTIAPTTKIVETPNLNLNWSVTTNGTGETVAAVITAIPAKAGELVHA